MDLLLRYLTDDPRKSINLIAVRNLLTLARNAPHLWTADHVNVSSINYLLFYICYLEIVYFVFYQWSK